MTRLGCVRDRMDERDYLMRAYLPVVKMPAKVDHTSKMTPVRDQGDEGTCVGFASTVGMKEYQEQVDYEKLVELSPRFLYNECKKIDGFDGEGTTIRTAMKVLKEYGVCREKYWPYKPHQQDKPKPGAKDNAKKFSVLTYARILNLQELKMSLVQKGPVVIGVEVFNGMMDAKNGVVPLPNRKESSLGGHAICPVGYDDKKKLVKFKNSWSESWGDDGYGYLPYAYIEQYMMDAWSSVDVQDPSPLTLAMVMGMVASKC
ncbi:MAG: C1 family peptidase [bacterium]|nr:C1 family peptidase [bacterium]